MAVTTLETIPNRLKLSTLEPILVQTKLQSDNPALYQFLLSLLRNSQGIDNIINSNITAINNTAGIGTGTGLTTAQMVGYISLRIL